MGSQDDSTARITKREYSALSKSMGDMTLAVNQLSNIAHATKQATEYTRTEITEMRAEMRELYKGKERHSQSISGMELRIKSLEQYNERKALQDTEIMANKGNAGKALWVAISASIVSVIISLITVMLNAKDIQ